MSYAANTEGKTQSAVHSNSAQPNSSLAELEAQNLLQPLDRFDTRHRGPRRSDVPRIVEPVLS